MEGRYHDLLAELAAGSWDGFELLPVGLYNCHGALVAGEMGVRTGNVYTSLTGFMDRSDPENSNAGKLQLAKLCEHLRDSGFAFWNLGHPYMPYKLALGAQIVQRKDFLRRLALEGGL
jgi:Leu/Phe-tRNA-protein transferase